MDIGQMERLTAERLSRGTMLPQHAYISPEWFDLEQRPVFDRRWVYVCHTSELAPGSFRRV
jgi:phenylpropionate dioxygenase-like ring-hydroxylating dioxygenase large terminal subunit